MAVLMVDLKVLQMVDLMDDYLEFQLVDLMVSILG